jgi:hypothetical protein
MATGAQDSMRDREDYPNKVVEIQEHDKKCFANEFTVAAFGEKRALHPKYHILSAHHVEGHEILTDTAYLHASDKRSDDCANDEITSRNMFGVAHERKEAQDRLYQQAKGIASRLGEEYNLQVIDTTGRPKKQQ